MTTRNEGNDTRYQEYIDGYTQRQYEASTDGDVYYSDRVANSVYTEAYWQGRGWYYLVGADTDGAITTVKSTDNNLLGVWDGTVHVATDTWWLHTNDLLPIRRERGFDTLDIMTPVIERITADATRSSILKFWALAETLHRLMQAETRIEAEAIIAITLDASIKTTALEYRTRTSRATRAARNHYKQLGARNNGN